MGTKGKKFIIAVTIVLLAAMLSGFGFFQKKNDEYRTIRVYKIEGTATVDRDGLGSMDAYEGMLLRSGDTVHTEKESCLYFQMDEDKYALLEPESTLHIEASGTSADSKTSFYLESGALVSRLDSKLSPDSVYEVNTPNSTMAVRGTIFRIEVTYDEKGVSFTNVYVFDGTVECQLVFQDGTVDEETKLAEQSVLVRIRGDNTVSEYIIDNGTVDYKQQPVEVLRFLKTAIEEGIALPIDQQELEAALAELEAAHTHSGGTASCISPAVCADCGQAYGERNPANHYGGTEIPNQKAATCTEPGYTGDACCIGCGAMLEQGRSTGKDTSNHTGGTEVRNAVTADCKTQGYTGDTYCLGCGEIIKSGSSTGKDTSNHTGGTEIRNAVTADCMTKGYTGDTHCSGCGQLLQFGSATDIDRNNHIGEKVTQDDRPATCHTEGYSGNVYCNACGYRISSGSNTPKNPNNHDGDMELRGDRAANCHAEGYTGDYYCTGCNQVRFSGSTIDIDLAKHDGGEELRDVKTGTCWEKGYSGNTYCTGCNMMLKAGNDTDTNPNNHVGGTYLDTESAKKATCCDEGYTGDTCCSDCGAVLTPGTAIPATGKHPAASCGASGHHLHDGLTHETPGCSTPGHCVSDGLNHGTPDCGTTGHYACDGLDHSPASCGMYRHYNCDGTTHGSNCDPTASTAAF